MYKGLPKIFYTVATLCQQPKHYQCLESFYGKAFWLVKKNTTQMTPKQVAEKPDGPAWEHIPTAWPMHVDVSRTCYHRVISMLRNFPQLANQTVETNQQRNSHNTEGNSS